MLQTIRAYYSLIKPGVLYGNVLTGIAGFLLAANGTIDWAVFAAAIGGMTLVIGSACVINNYLDQDIDRVMERTKTRAIVSGKVTPRGALAFGILLGLVGFAWLTLGTNGLVVGVGVVGFVTYVWLYGALSKRRSVHGTLVGSISGAMPIVGGYVAVRGTIDAGAVLIALILFFWQMSEFYAISLYRRREYAQANVPVISVVYGPRRTVMEILIYTFLCAVTMTYLWTAEYVGITYLLLTSAGSIVWLVWATKGLYLPQSAIDAWAKKMFRWSLVMIVLFSLLLIASAWLP